MKAGLAIRSRALSSRVRVVHRPRLLSDNGSSYLSDDLAKWLERHDMSHVRGRGPHSAPGDDAAISK